MNPGIWQSFRDTYWFWALVPIAALLLWRLTRKGPQSAVFYFSSDRASLDSWAAKGRRSLYLLRFLALGFLVAALARPSDLRGEYENHHNRRDRHRALYRCEFEYVGKRP